MWNLNPRVLRVRLPAVVAAAAILLSLYVSAAATPPHRPAAQTAAACGDVVINEVLFRPVDPPDDEWVELYTVNELESGTELTVSDLETSGGQFSLTFTLTENVPGNRYIVVHGNDAAEAQEPDIGFANFFNAGNGSDLANSSDNVVLSINGTICEEVHWGSGSTPATTAPVTRGYGSTSSIASGESIQRSPNGPDGQFVRGTTAGQFNAAEGHNIGRNNVDGTLAVTLAWFASERNGDTVRFGWQTATETGTAGFNLLAETAAGREQLNTGLIASPRIDSVTPTEYAYDAATTADVFYLHEVTVDGKVEEFGPFSLGSDYGVYIDAGGDDASVHAGRTLYLPVAVR